MVVLVVLGMDLRYNQADHMLEQVEELHQVVTLVSLLVETAHKTLVEVAVALLSNPPDDRGGSGGSGLVLIAYPT